VSRHRHGAAADRPGTDDADAEADDVPRQRRVDGVAEGVLDRRYLDRDPRVHRIDVGLWDGHVLGKAARPVDPDDRHVLADVGVASAALVTRPVRDMTFHGHEGAELGLGYRRPDLLHLAAELVAEDEGRADPALGPLVPGHDVQVGTADADPSHAQERLAGLGNGHGGGAGPERPRALVE